MSLSVNNTYLSTSGTSGNYASTPNAAPIQFGATLTIDAWLAPNLWKPAAAGVIFAKWGLGAGLNSYLFRLNTTGVLIFTASSDGSASTLNTSSSVAVTAFNANGIGWVRVTFTANSASGLRFWTSPDGVTWTQLGTSSTTTAIATTIFNGTQIGEIGADGGGSNNPLAANFYRVLAYSSDLGSSAGTAAFDANFTLQNPDTTSFSESSANAATVTVNVSGQPRAVITRAGLSNNYQGISVADNGNAVMSVTEKIR